MKRHPSRLIPVALAAVLVLGACGSEDDGSAETPPEAEDTAADDGLVAPRPIEISAGSGAQTANAESAEADRQMATDMVAPYQPQVVTFVPGEGLPALPTNDVGYMFAAGTPATQDQVVALAAALGVDGEPVAIEDPMGTSWRVGPEDGTAPSLWVSSDPQLSWSYSSAWADRETSVGCAVAGSAGEGAPAVDPAVSDEPTIEPATSEPVKTEPAVETPVCETPAPPEGVPSGEEAEARTRELMDTVGLDPNGYELETYADEWSAGVTATEMLDGVFAGRNFSTGFGAGGELQYAGGQLAEPVRVGPYPLIDLETAIARLNDPARFYGGGMIALDTATARAAEEAPVAVDVPEVDVDAAVEPPPVSAVPVEIPAPEEVTVTLVDVQPDIWWVWDVDNSAWLLPAYRFIGDDGGWYTVPAVTDEFLIHVPVPDVPVTEPAPLPVDTAPVDTAPVETAPVDTAPVDTMADATPLEASIGKTLAEFTADAEALGLSVRVIEQDGESLPATMDLVPTRVNIAVQGEGETGTVTAIVNVG